MEFEKVEKPWGYEMTLEQTEGYIFRFLHLNAGAAVSLQYHEHKTETLYILKGNAEYTFQRPGEERTVRIVGPGDILHHEPYEIHRQRAITDFEFLEVSSPDLTDIIRLEDDYNRGSH